MMVISFFEILGLANIVWSLFDDLEFEEFIIRRIPRMETTSTLVVRRCER
jgi:hypothetical protein